ncbi:MAG: SMP-30/gluconolactonase/LRE family protein [Rhizobiaceae bacterium]|nr:SMP-30/gluconolactonase/LRE family protein [Rhizobiaceae bacterium]
MNVSVFDTRTCILGEGPLWHPIRKQLFWFDIIGKKLLSQSNGEKLEWQFEECVSAAGWIDTETLLVASETGLYRFDISSGEMTHVIDLEKDNIVTRSNDGRADPWGGFWIGTMGKRLEPRAGAIYRYYNGSITKLYSDISIPNAICFSPDKKFGYFADTGAQQIMRQELDHNGWPKGEPEVLIDLRNEGINPDGAVTDREGNIWNSQWGASRVACYGSDGSFKLAIDLPASQSTCPAFGGEDLKTLFMTSAAEGLQPDTGPHGQTFLLSSEIAGLPEPQAKI